MSTSGTQGVDSAVAGDSGKTGVRWRIFLLMLGLVTINYVDRASLSIAMPLISEEFALSPALQGILLSCFFWTYALMQIPGGWLADRFGPRAVIASATVFWGAFQALTAAAFSSAWLLTMRLGLGASEGPIFPSGGKLNASWMPQQERGRGAVLLDGGAPLGTALGGIIIAGLIALFDSWRLAFIIAGAGTVAAGVFAYWYIRNRPGEHPAVNEAEATYIATEHAREDEQTLPPQAGRRSVFNYLRFPSFWGMGLGWFGFNLVFYGLVTWAPTYLSETRGLSIGAIGGATFFIFGAGFVGELVGGYTADFWRERGGTPNLVMRTVLGVSGVLTTLSIFLVAFVGSPIAAVALLASTLFFLRWAGLYWSIPSILTDRSRAGVLGGMMNFMGNIAGIAVPIIIGVIVEITGSFFLGLMFFAAAGVLFLVSSLSIDYSRRLPV